MASSLQRRVTAPGGRRSSITPERSIDWPGRTRRIPWSPLTNHTLPFRSVHADLSWAESSTALPLTHTARPRVLELSAPLTTRRSRAGMRLLLGAGGGSGVAADIDT